MNLFTGRNLNNDECIFDVHSFARELDEDTLRTKVNGGCCDASAPPAPPAGNNTPKAPAITGTTPTTNPGTSPTTNTPNPSDPSNPGSGYTGGGYEPPPEVMSNPQAYGYWKALQALAEQQGDPDRYKDYNVLPDYKQNTIKGYKSLNPYEGQYTVAPNLFTQTQFTKEYNFNEQFHETACFATGVLNTVSMQYTKETGKKMTFEDGVGAMKQAIKDGNISKENAKVSDYARAANSMINYIEDKYNDSDIFGGSFSYKNNDDSIKYSVNKSYSQSNSNDSSNLNGSSNSNPNPYHFTNDMGPSYKGGNKRVSFDTFSGHINTFETIDTLSVYYNYYR